IALTSAPVQNARPVPVTMRIHTLPSFSASLYARRNSVTICGLSALRASGRFSVIVALCPATSYLMVSYDGAELADINVPCCLVGMDIDAGGHRPLIFGGRRSRNAARPSLKSPVLHESSRPNNSCVIDWLSVACWP